MSSPDVIKQSKLAASTGWVEVDQFSLQHVRYPNVFALGDCSNLPTSKTGAAIRKQAPTLVENLLAAMDGRPLEAVYDGYTSCPLVTGYGSLILAEFDYQLTPKESFPFDQSKERYSILHLQETFSDVVKTDKTGLSKTAHTRWMISAFANFLPGSTIFRLA